MSTRYRPGPLFTACEIGNASVAAVLLKAKASANTFNVAKNSVSNIVGLQACPETPLSVACKRGRLSIAKLLLTHKARIAPSVHGPTDAKGHTETKRLLFDATTKGQNPEFVRWLAIEMGLHGSFSARGRFRSKRPLELLSNTTAPTILDRVAKCARHHGFFLLANWLASCRDFSPLRWACAARDSKQVQRILLQHGNSEDAACASRPLLLNALTGLPRNVSNAFDHVQPPLYHCKTTGTTIHFVGNPTRHAVCRNENKERGEWWISDHHGALKRVRRGYLTVRQEWSADNKGRFTQMLCPPTSAKVRWEVCCSIFGPRKRRQEKNRASASWEPSPHVQVELVGPIENPASVVCISADEKTLAKAHAGFCGEVSKFVGEYRMQGWPADN